MKINYNKILYISATVFFASLLIMYFFFNGTPLMWPLFIVAMIAVAIMIFSSSWLMVRPLNNLENSDSWKKLSKKEQWIIGGLILISLGLMWYLDIHSYIAGPIIISFTIWAVKLYSKNKNK